MVHHVLLRQIRRYYKEDIPHDLEPLMSVISDTYTEFDEDRRLIERSLDISSSELSSINANLLDSLNKQKQLEKMKTQFLSLITHELRAPMSPMRGQLQMMLAGYFGELNADMKKSTEMILRNTNRLDSLIGDILDISKLDSGNMRFSFSKIKLKAVVENTVETMRLKAKEKNIDIELAIDADPEITADSDRVTQIIVNLLTNATKFSEPNSKIYVSVKTGENDVTISVKDTGVGISKEDQATLFQPFVQVASSLPKNHEGTGLGLAICKGIVDNHGGRIWIESEPGKGSTFIFTLPFNHVEAKPIALFEEKTASTGGKK